MCDHCGEYIDAEMLQLLDIQEVNEVEDGSVVETSNEEISVTCDDCGASFAETGVYLLFQTSSF